MGKIWLEIFSPSGYGVSPTEYSLSNHQLILHKRSKGFGPGPSDHSISDVHAIG